MTTQILKCSICSHKWVPALSKRETACPNCVHIEKHGISLRQAAEKKRLEQVRKMAERAQAKQAGMPPKKRPAIPNFSEKGLAKAKAVADAKKRIKSAAKEGAFYECQGCLKWFKVIDASHKIPLSQNENLAASEDNMTLLCRGCHSAWENGTVMEMIDLHCFVSDMQYLYEHDGERFHKIFFRMMDEYERTGSPKLKKVITQLESFWVKDSENEEL